MRTTLTTRTVRTIPALVAAAVTAATLAFAPAVASHQSGHDRAADTPAASTGGPVHAAEGGDGVLRGAEDLPTRCLDDLDTTHPFEVEVDDPTSNVEETTARGAIAFPDTQDPFAPRDLVVFAHGYGHSSHSWLGHLRWAAEELGAVAVAMDYRGTLELPADGEVGGTRGWQVREGAADSNAAATAILTACPNIRTVTLFGVSMGANTSGLALAAQPTRPGGDEPLYDWWLNVEGAANVLETYLEARSLAASGNAFANNAVVDIEREVGGPFEDDPQGYVDLAVVSHVQDIAASGIRGVFHVHGVEDGLVPYDQSRELWAGLRAASANDLAQEFWTALRRDPDGPDPDEDQTNISDYVIGAVDPSWESPLVGHGSEASADNDVMHFSLDRLRRLLVEGEPIVNCVEGSYDDGEEVVVLGTGCGTALPPLP